MKNKNMLIFIVSALLCLPIFLFADTETEPNDTWDATGVLEVENGVHDGEIDPGSDVDYWAFQASADDFIEVSTIGLTTLDTQLWLFDTDGVTELEYNDDSGGTLQSYLSHTISEDGTYYFKVGIWGSTPGAYGVELSGANIPVHYDNDLQARWITGNATPTVGIESIYEVMVKNPGDLAQLGSDYTVSLFLEGDTEIGTVPGANIDPGEQIGFNIPWTPEYAVITYIYGVVNFAADELLDNNVTDNFDVNVQSAGTIIVSVGDGNEMLNTIPADFYYKNSLAEMWYYPEEINFGGLITQIGYHNNFVTNLIDTPLRVWMCESTQPQAAVGWIGAGDMTLVFDGTVNIPSGENDILIPLDTFFGYSGGDNLVIMVNRPMDTEYYDYDDLWFCTTDVMHPSRTVEIHSDSNEFDPYNPSGGNLINDFPNIGLYFDPTPTGSLEGFVYESARDPIEGAYVQIEETTFGTYTDDTGYYSFPYVFEGEYDITASAFGYYDETVTGVLITEGQTTPQDFNLDQLPNVEVYGHVITSDTGADVEGAIVTLEGYDNYETVTLADGTFLIEGVYCDQTYGLTVSGYDGYETYEDENVVVGDTNLDLGDIIINEMSNPPFGVYVEEDHNGFAEMTWHAPGSAPPGMEDFEDGEANDYIFSDDRWGVDTGRNYYLQFTGQSLGSNGSAYWDNEVDDFTMEFEVQKNSGNYDYAHGAFIRANGFLSGACDGYRINMTQNGSYCVIRYDAGGYTFIQGWTTAVNLLTGAGVPNIATIVATGADFEIYFNGALEYSFTDATHSSGFCNVIAYDISADVVWFDYVNVMPGARTVADISNFTPVTGKALIGGNENMAPASDISSTPVEFAAEHRTSINSNSTINRVIEGYDIKRLLAGEEEQPENWVEIVTGVADTTYLDESWADLEIPGIYRYAVIAAYTNNVYSNPAFSNTIEKDMYTEVTVNVTTNSGDDPIGANVMLTCQDEDPAHVYTMSAPTGGVCFFPEVFKGIYNLAVTLTGYEGYAQEDINIFDVITLPVELAEIIGVLGELTGEDIGFGAVLLTWTWSGAGNLLFVDDDGSAYLEFTDTQPYYTALFDEMRLDYTIHDITEDGADGPDAAAMAAYDVVLWECGEQWSGGRTITDNDEDNLGTYIDGGGKVIISAHDYLWDRYPAAGAFTAGQFPYDYLGLASATQDVYTVQGEEVVIDGSAGSYVDGLSVLLQDIFSMREGVFLDDLTPNAIGADYSTYDAYVIGVQTENTIFTTAGYAGLLDGTNTAVEYLAESINNLFCARDREFLGFTITRDGAEIATGVMDMTYTDHVDANDTYEYTVTANYTTGNSNTISTTVVVTSISAPSNTIPVVTTLTGNYPNPFNPVTSIAFSIKEASQVTIEIYNLRGEKVNTLINDYLEPNYYNFEWNGRDENNKSVASGVYFYKMKAGRYTSTKKMILMK